MSGNATEEYLLTKLDYPGHLDSGRIAGLGGSLIAVSIGLISSNWVSGGAAFAIGMLAGLFFGSMIWSRMENRNIEKRANSMAIRRMEREAATNAAIKIMNVEKGMNYNVKN